jgi:putative restriction endonuclease
MRSSWEGEAGWSSAVRCLRPGALSSPCRSRSIGCGGGLGRAGHEAAPVDARRRACRAQPLLLLYALGHFQRYGDTPIPFSEAEEHLNRLLREFGPPRVTTAAYPFHHLATDGLWTVSTAAGVGSPGASPKALRGQQAVGRFAPDLAWSLRTQPQLLPQLAHVILDTNFEPSLHEDICAEAGLDLEAAETEPASQDPRRRRDPEFRRSVLVAYEYRCAFCGYDGLLDGSMVGLEAAYVRWWTHGGPDEVANGLCLCSIHHKLLDKGVLGITDHHQVAVSVHFVGRSARSGGSSARQPGRSFTASTGLSPDGGLQASHTAQGLRSASGSADGTTSRWVREKARENARRAAVRRCVLKGE